MCKKILRKEKIIIPPRMRGFFKSISQIFVHSLTDIFLWIIHICEPSYIFLFSGALIA